MKRKVITILISFYVILILIATSTVVIDPLFHYHKPLSFLQYRINNQRYHNDGITRNFEYNAIITGTSMSENFKTSELDRLFNTNSIKIPYSGASFHEITTALDNAFRHNHNINIVVRSLDGNKLIENADSLPYSNYPSYLYDDNVINDVYYLLNKDILLDNTIETINHTLKGRKTKSFDEYCNWMDSHKFGKEAVLDGYVRNKKSKQIIVYDSKDYDTEIKNINENIIRLANEHKDTEFYYFLPPYSIVFFDGKNQNGELEKYFASEKVAIEALLKVKNIHLYAFLDCYDITTNLDNYTDSMHYSEDINSYILESMSNNSHLLTISNYQDYCKETCNFYSNYNYDDLYK